MSTPLTPDVQVVAQAILSTSTTALHNLGERVNTNDGRSFRYALAGATALVAGTLQQSAAEVTANENLTAVAAAIGDIIIASTSTVTIAANQYQFGTVNVTVTPGVGYAYRIRNHLAYTAAAPSFNLDDAVNVALTTTSRLDLVANPYSSVIINPTTATAPPVGVAVFPVAIAGYGWLQTHGSANVLADGTVTVGTTLVASNGTAGAVEAFAGVQAVVGIAQTGIATTEYGAVFMTLD